MINASTTYPSATGNAAIIVDATVDSLEAGLEASVKMLGAPCGKNARDRVRAHSGGLGVEYFEWRKAHPLE